MDEHCINVGPYASRRRWATKYKLTFIISRKALLFLPLSLS
jgi:hypothetical protein